MKPREKVLGKKPAPSGQVKLIYNAEERGGTAAPNTFRRGGQQSRSRRPGNELNMLFSEYYRKG